MSRRRKTLIISLSLLIAACLAILDNCLHKHIPNTPATDTQTAAASDFARYHRKQFTVTNIVDGDTLDIDIPDGQHDTTRIRLWGVDTPETKAPGEPVAYFGPEAARFATENALGKKVTVYLSERDSRGKYGRLLGYVQLPEGQFLNELLLAEGFAYADLRFEHDFYHKYTQLESLARSQKKGLWKEVARANLPEWLQQRKPTLLKNR